MYGDGDGDMAITNLPLSHNYGRKSWTTPCDMITQQLEIATLKVENNLLLNESNSNTPL